MKIHIHEVMIYGWSYLIPANENDYNESDIPRKEIIDYLKNTIVYCEVRWNKLNRAFSFWFAYN